MIKMWQLLRFEVTDHDEFLFETQHSHSKSAWYHMLMWEGSYWRMLMMKKMMLMVVVDESCIVVVVVAAAHSCILLCHDLVKMDWVMMAWDQMRQETWCVVVFVCMQAKEDAYRHSCLLFFSLSKQGGIQHVPNTHIYLSFSQAVSPHGAHHPCFYVQHPIDPCTCW